MSTAAAPLTGKYPVRHLLQRLTRLQGPEQEQTINLQPLSTNTFPASIKTDKFIWGLLVQLHLRIQVGGTAFTPLVNAIANLIQELRVYGTHTRYGAQVPVRMRGQSLWDLSAQFAKAYQPQFYVNGVRGGSFAGAANTNYDVDMFLVVPFPTQGIPLADQILNGALKGPDWAGDLHVAMDIGDGTSLGTTAGNITISAFGSNSGNGQILLSLIRPNLGTMPDGTAIQSLITPSICFKTYKAIDAILQGSNLVGQKISDLNVGKKMARIIVKTGVQQTSTSAGVLVYASLSDAIITRAFPALDGKNIKNPYNSASTRELEFYFREAVPVKGYNIIDWIEGGNIQSAFPSQGLTSSRRWELDGDVTAASNQIGEVMMEELLGDPILPQVG
jgi:hypothetical protein